MQSLCAQAMCCCFHLALSFRTLLDGQKTPTHCFGKQSLDLGVCVQNCPTSEVAAMQSLSHLSPPWRLPHSSLPCRFIHLPKGESWIARSLWTLWQHLAVRTQAGESWIPSLIFTGVFEWQSSAALTRKSHFTHRTTSVCCIQAHKGDGSAGAAQK